MPLNTIYINLLSVFTKLNNVDYVFIARSILTIKILNMWRLLQNSLDAQNLFHVQRRETGLGAAIAGMM